jgi:hypothetical protein
MPYAIRKKGDKHEVYNPQSGKVYGTHPTYGKAQAQMRALYVNAPPDEENKSLNLSYIKSMGWDELPDCAVKSIGKDEIQGYTALWGNPGRVDLDREYFTPETDFWDSVLKGNRPLTWDHAQDSETKSDPIIGDIVKMGDDKVGRWYVAKLKRAHAYRAAVDQLIADKAVGTSSDSAPQYVLRERTGKAVWLKRWPLFAAALTEVPCEPRQVATVDYFKSLGVVMPDPMAPDEQVRAEVEAMKRRYEMLRIST